MTEAYPYLPHVLMFLLVVIAALLWEIRGSLRHIAHMIELEMRERGRL